MNMLGAFASVAAGGALGASCRYAASLWWSGGAGGVPVATLLVNLCGSFLAGLLYALIVQRSVPPNILLLFLATGFLGALTTFSTFSVETLALLLDQRPQAALLNAACNLFGSLLAVMGGFFLLSSFLR